MEPLALRDVHERRDGYAREVRRELYRPLARLLEGALEPADEGDVRREGPGRAVGLEPGALHLYELAGSLRERAAGRGLEPDAPDGRHGVDASERCEERVQTWREFFCTAKQLGLYHI